MNATLSNENDTQTNRNVGFDPVYTTPWCTQEADISSWMRLGLSVHACLANPQAGDQKSWVKQMASYEAVDDTGAFELIPSLQEKGYYGARKIEKRPSAPTLPVVYLKPAPEPCKAKAEPFRSVLMYLAEMGKYTAEVIRAHKEATTDSMKHVLALISGLTVSPASRKDKWDARLDELHTFESGWDSYDAEAPSVQSIENARAFMTFLRTIAKEPAALNPSAVGGVGFTFRHGKRSVYIEFRNTGNAHAVFMGAGKPRVEKVLQSTDGFRAVIHQVETHLYEQDAAAARNDEARWPTRY